MPSSGPKYKILGQGSMEKSPSVKCSSPKHYDLNSTSQIHIKTPGGITWNPTPGQVGKQKPQQVLTSQTK